MSAAKQPVANPRRTRMINAPRDRALAALSDVASWTTAEQSAPIVDGTACGTVAVAGQFPSIWRYLVRVLDVDTIDQVVHLEVRARPESGPGVVHSIFTVRAASCKDGTSVQLTPGRGDPAVLDALSETLLAAAEQRSQERLNPVSTLRRASAWALPIVIVAAIGAAVIRLGRRARVETIDVQLRGT